MSTTITVKTKFRINGQEYASVDDMPAEVRQAYERAMSTLGQTGGPVHISPVSTKVVFNGQGYASADQMPADVRRLYDDVMATLDTQRASAAAAASPASAAPWQSGASRVVAREASTATAVLRPESTSSRLLIVGVALAALLLASVWLGR